MRSLLRSPHPWRFGVFFFVSFCFVRFVSFRFVSSMVLLCPWSLISVFVLLCSSFRLVFFCFVFRRCCCWSASFVPGVLSPKGSSYLILGVLSPKGSWGGVDDATLAIRLILEVSVPKVSLGGQFCRACQRVVPLGFVPQRNLGRRQWRRACQRVKLFLSSPGFRPPGEALRCSSGFCPPREAGAESMMPRLPADVGHK